MVPKVRASSEVADSAGEAETNEAAARATEASAEAEVVNFIARVVREGRDGGDGEGSRWDGELERERGGRSRQAETGRERRERGRGKGEGKWWLTVKDDVYPSRVLYRDVGRGVNKREDCT